MHAGSITYKNLRIIDELFWACAKLEITMNIRSTMPANIDY